MGVAGRKPPHLACLEGTLTTRTRKAHHARLVRHISVVRRSIDPAKPAWFTCVSRHYQHANTNRIKLGSAQCQSMLCLVVKLNQRRASNLARRSQQHWNRVAFVVSGPLSKLSSQLLRVPLLLVESRFRTLPTKTLPQFPNQITMDLIVPQLRRRSR